MNKFLPAPPTHEAIARRAHTLWSDRGSPGGHDLAIWLEAEQQLTTLTSERRIPFANPAEVAAMATFQKNAARSPRRPTHASGPKFSPLETGKPLWPTVH